ncbi:TPA: hypothetical protein I8510_004046 [Aeromonas hydrophila]|nr:hypothetical protein [Aeromonas hydrophila]
MRINKQALSRPEFRKLRDNLQVIHGTQPTVVGSLLSALAAIGELVFTIALVVVLIVDTRYTVLQMGMGLVASLVLHWLAKVYDKRFAELPHS